MGEFKADSALIDRLRNAASHVQTAHEITRQKLSFAISNIRDAGPETRIRAEVILREKTTA